MPRTRAEIKADLQAEAERLIDALLDWTDQTEAPNLTQIEDEVLKLRQQFAEKLAEAAVEGQATADPGRPALQPSCPAQLTGESSGSRGGHSGRLPR